VQVKLEFSLWTRMWMCPIAVCFLNMEITSILITYYSLRVHEPFLNIGPWWRIDLIFPQQCHARHEEQRSYIRSDQKRKRCRWEQYCHQIVIFGKLPSIISTFILVDCNHYYIKLMSSDLTRLQNTHFISILGNLGLGNSRRSERIYSRQQIDAQLVDGTLFAEHCCT
jgi:hypothetical protein